jgi:hypothetical protein
MIPVDKFKEIAENLGKNSDEAFALIISYPQDAATAIDEQGLTLLAHAIRMNDGRNVAELLTLGADMHAPFSAHSPESCYDYAKKYATYNGREPFAFEAMESFKNIQENLNVSMLSNSLFNNILSTTDERDAFFKKHFEEIKNKKDDELISFYHGMKIDSIEKDVIDSVAKAFMSSNSLQEHSGPTLSIVPFNTYWPGLGLEIKIPRSKVKFPGEKNENAVLEVGEGCTAMMLTQDRKIKFDEFYTRPLLNFRACIKKDVVMPSYGVEEGAYKANFNLEKQTLESLNNFQALMEENHKKVLEKSANTEFKLIDKTSSLLNMGKLRNKVFETEKANKLTM